MCLQSADLFKLFRRRLAYRGGGGNFVYFEAIYKHYVSKSILSMLKNEEKL